MSLIYREISRNQLKTWLYISLFVGILTGLGVLIGSFYEEPLYGLAGVFIFSLIYLLFSWFMGDRVALSINHAKPLQKKDHPRLYRIVENLSIAYGMPTPKIYLIDDPSLNAFATGLRQETATVAFTKGIVEHLTDAELEGVAAHELSHIKNKDTQVSILVMMLVGVISLIAGLFRNIFWYGGRHFRGRGKNAGGTLLMLLFTSILATLASFFAVLIQFAVSRRRESLADASAALLTRYPKGLASALEKLKKDHHTLRYASRGTAHLFLVNPFKRDFLKNLFATHPPIEERIKALQAMDIDGAM